MEENVNFRVGVKTLNGIYRPVEDAHGLVVFANSGRNMRMSPRGQQLAAKMNRTGIATLSVDLLDEDETKNRWRAFDADVMSERLKTALRWVDSRRELKRLPIGLFGAGTGAGAALLTAAQELDRVRTVVCRSGRPDLATRVLRKIRIPTLFIVGGEDKSLAELNRQALRDLRCEKALVVVPGAGSLYNEPGAYDEMSRITISWFERFLKAEGGLAAPPPLHA